MIYGFNSEDVAFALKGIGEERLTGNGSDPAPTGKEVIFVKTPAEGIPARDGTTVEEADCTRVYLDEDLELQESDDQTVPVANTEETMIAGDTYIKAVMLGVSWIAATGGTGTTTAMFVSTSTITGNSEGTANIRTFNGTSWTTDTGTSYTIVNPWADDVSTAKNLTAYSHSSGKWVMIQAECEDPV